MNKREQELYISFLEELYQAEQATLHIKQNMAKCLGFNPILLFQTISDGANQITIPQLRQYLNTRTACNQRELYEIFQRFDWSRQGFISLDDFLIQITPFGEQPFNPRQTKGTVTPQIEGHFISLLVEYIQRLRIIQVSRKQIDFIAPYNAFEQIDYMKTGLIGLGELRRFFDVNDFKINDFQLRLLLHALRRRCYLQVNLQVFCQNLFPLEFGEYEAYANQVRNYQQQQFLRRSRKEQQTMKRSRIESQKIDHQIQKQQRRKRAQLERELQLQNRINREILDHEKQKDRYYRKAVLEEDKNIRWNVQTGSKIIEDQRLRNQIERQRNAQLSAYRNQQNQVKQYLARSAIRKEDQLQASRRAKIYEQQLALRNQIQRQRQLRNSNYFNDISASRRRYQQQMKLQRDMAMREYQRQRLRNTQTGVNIRNKADFYESRRTPADSRRNQRDYENEYQSRLESRIQNTWSGKRGMPQTAQRSYGY